MVVKKEKEKKEHQFKVSPFILFHTFTVSNNSTSMDSNSVLETNLLCWLVQRGQRSCSLTEWLNWRCYRGLVCCSETHHQPVDTWIRSRACLIQSSSPHTWRSSHHRPAAGFRWAFHIWTATARQNNTFSHPSLYHKAKINKTLTLKLSIDRRLPTTWDNESLSASAAGLQCSYCPLAAVTSHCGSAVCVCTLCVSACGSCSAWGDALCLFPPHCGLPPVQSQTSLPLTADRADRADRAVNTQLPPRLRSTSLALFTHIGAALSHSLCNRAASPLNAVFCIVNSSFGCNGVLSKSYKELICELFRLCPLLLWNRTKNIFVSCYKQSNTNRKQTITFLLPSVGRSLAISCTFGVWVFTPFSNVQILRLYCVGTCGHFVEI